MLAEGRRIVNRIEIDGLKISVEVEAGGTRTGISKNGERWEQKVSASYGYILGTNSPDGEHLDCWVRKNPKSGAHVYVIHQLTPDGTAYDEDKVMLGYSSRDEAVEAFKRHAFRPRKMYGGVSEFEMEHFKVIAYSARNSKVMLASQALYDKFSDKGLIPKGIKSPIALSKVVKESTNMALNVSYESALVAESAFELARNAGLNVLRSHTNIIFESEADLSSFIRLIDESLEDRAHLGDLADNLPDDFDIITKANLDDAVEDLKTELQVDDDHQDTVVDIASEYGLDADELEKAFEHATGKAVGEWASHRATKPLRENTDVDVDSLIKLAGVSEQSTRYHDASIVHLNKQKVSSLTESHNKAIRKFMVNSAVRKQKQLVESVQQLDLDVTLRRFANTLLKYPRVPTATIYAKVSESLPNGHVLREYIEAATGLNVDDFRAAISQRKWAGNVITKQSYNSLMEQVETHWNINNPDKGELFKRFCK